MIESNEYDKEFLNLHSEIKKLSKKFLTASNFIMTFAPDDDAKRIELVEFFINHIVEGYIEVGWQDDDQRNLREIILKPQDRHGRKKLIVDEIRNNRKIAVEYLLGILSKKHFVDLCVIYIEFNRSAFESIAKLFSQPEIISGIHIDAINRRVKNKKNFVAFCIDGDNEENEILIQSSLKNKGKLYDILSCFGDIKNNNYKETSLIQRGLLWGVPPLPNAKQARAVIENLKKT